ncbi:MAG: hydrogen gas-evolving membrane-bound hydrogenase subunit E [Butyricicoccus sp.]
MKRRSDYAGSRADKFQRWLHGEYDPFAGKLEMHPGGYEEPPACDISDGVDHARVQRVVDDWAHNKEMRAFRMLYKIASFILCIALIGVLLLTVANLPPFGAADNPAHNEVMERYLEKGVEETGAVNAVTGMILNYRAFDTFGETCVLFIAACCVMILLEGKTNPADTRLDERFEPKDDPILYRITLLLGPIVMLFGVYIILNGHLSPGGGFSGGAMIGAGLILFCNALGLTRTRRFFNEHVYKMVKVGSLTLYGITMSYYFFTGGNRLTNIIPLGTPGNLFSSGMILPINMFVGLEVACTMYSFFALFRRGEL